MNFNKFIVVSVKPKPSTARGWPGTYLFSIALNIFYPEAKLEALRFISVSFPSIGKFHYTPELQVISF